MSTNPIKNGQRNGGSGTDMDKKNNFVNQKLNKKPEDDKATSNRKVFVGGLNSNTTKDNLVEYFSKYGGVEDANIKMDPNTGRSRGYGFVLFETKEIADQVLSMSEHNIMGKSVDVKTAKYKGTPPVKKVFVGGLDPNFPEAELREYFSQYGKIEEIEMPFDKQKNQRRSFCFILYETEESVNEVLKKSKHLLGGKEVDVKKATPPKDQNQQNALLQPQWNQLGNWNMGNNYFQPDPTAQGYGTSAGLAGAGIYNAPSSFGGAPNSYNAQNSGYNSQYNQYQQPQVAGGANYPTAYGDNFEAGYVDYDDPTAYEYAAAGGNGAFPGAVPPYDQQSAFYQNNPMNGSYDGYSGGGGGYDNSMYNNYSAHEQQYSHSASHHSNKSSSSSHHSYGKVSKRSSQSQSYHPYNR